MLRLSIAVLTIVAILAPRAHAQGPTVEQHKDHPQLVFEMTPAMIDEAVAHGTRETRPRTTYPILAGLRGNKSFVAAVSTPYARVVAAAADAKRRYQAFTPADVTPEMIAPELHIYAPSIQSGARAYDVETVVIMPKMERDVAAIVRPLRTAEIGEVYRNLLGAQFEGKGMLAVFPLTMFVTDHEVRIVRRDFPEMKARIEVKREFR